MMDVLSAQIGISGAVVHLLEWLKKANWFPWISQNTGKINRTIAILIALATSVGIVIETQGDYIVGGIITITMPPLSVIGSSLIHALTQVVIQEGYYQGIVKK